MNAYYMSLFLPSQTATTTLSIVVTDINDNNPTFLSPQYNFAVDENVVNAPVGRVSVRDSFQFVFIIVK